MRTEGICGQQDLAEVLVGDGQVRVAVRIEINRGDFDGQRPVCRKEDRRREGPRSVVEQQGHLIRVLSRGDDVYERVAIEVIQHERFAGNAGVEVCGSAQIESAGA